MTTTTRLRLWSPLAALSAALTLILLGTTAAHAAELHVTYDASGTTHIAGTGSDIDLGPATLDTTLDTDTLEFSGTMDLPGTRTEFSIAGFLPATADVEFEAAGPVTGTLATRPDGAGVDVAANATYHVRLSNIKIAGFPTFTGPFCRTADPVSIDLANRPDEPFLVFSGGTVVGDYDIGQFQHCGFNTWLINVLVPGDGNTIEIDLSDAQVS